MKSKSLSNRKKPGTLGSARANRFRIRALSCGLALALLAGCAMPHRAADPNGYSRDAAAEVFSAGFEGITSFYIEETDLPSLVLSGLNGMQKIDSGIAVNDRDDSIVVSRNGKDVAAFSIPDADDVARWSILTAAAIDSGRQVSRSLRATPSEVLYDTVFRNALSDLDRFSRYTSAAEAERNRAHRRGYSGLGIVLQEDAGIVRIQDIFEDGPAANAGLRIGDALISVDDRNVTGMDIVAVSDLLRGSEGSVVSLTVESHDTRSTVQITRAPVIEQTVFLKRYQNSAYLQVRSFNEATASTLRRKIAQAAAGIGPDLNGLIIDLRGNRGGVLRDAVSISDLFITRGRILLTKGRHPRSEKEFEAHKPDIADGIPLIVLINHDSASASEVVAGALQDSGRAVLVGSRTYGKGTVQMIVRLPNDGELIITWARMYTPSGYPISPFGIYPTICTAEINESDFHLTGGTARATAVRARELLRLRRIAHDLDDSIQKALLDRCGDREPAPEGSDPDLALAVRMLEERALFESAFEASLIASKWPSGSQ